MVTITISNNLMKENDLIAISQEEYKRLLSFSFPKKEILLNSSQKNRLASARKNLKSGKFLTFNELQRKMGVKS